MKCTECTDHLRHIKEIEDRIHNHLDNKNTQAALRLIPKLQQAEHMYGLHEIYCNAEKHDPHNT